MRIISGKFKGKKILQPKDKNTRPLKDLTKESIFNIIAHSKKLNINLENSNILDLFSGVGSFGIECISRGAKKVTFVENYHDVLPILKKNLDNLKSEISYEIIKDDIYQNFKIENLKDKFDLIFLDPPYKDKNLRNILTNIYSMKILNNDGLIIVHRHKREGDAFPDFLSVIEEKTYGIAKIIFLTVNLD
jgi:16S rRNA (guanine966-N2)-methyltransferase